MIGLTERQAEALAFIRTFMGQHGFSPSYREIAEALGLKSSEGIHRIVHGLVRRGAISMRSGRGRSISLAEQTEVLAERERCAAIAREVGQFHLASLILDPNHQATHPSTPVRGGTAHQQVSAS